MRWLLGSVLALLFTWALFLASPYLALARFAGAVADRNLEAIGQRVNVHALRISFTKQLIAEGLTLPELEGVAGSDAQLAAGAVLALGHPALERLISAQGIRSLLAGAEGDPTGTGAAPLGPHLLERPLALIGASRWRGFRTITFGLPPGSPEADRFHLRFRLARGAWRLTAIELPSRLRAALVASIRSRLSR